MRKTFCLCLFLMLCGCTPRFTTLLMPRDQQLFASGMKEVAARKSLPADLVILQETYPDSPWSAGAETVDSLLKTIQSQQEVIKKLQRGETSCRKENQELQQKKEQLEKDLEKFKQLLIDLEKRGR